MTDEVEGAESAFRFDGNWREYAPIAFTNLLLMIVTLGIYRFWATTRTRRYLWSRTHFIDDHLQWTGTGGELFRGFLLAMLIFLPVMGGLIFGYSYFLQTQQAGLAALCYVALLFSALYLSGVARFRALRYRLGRTYWHGIRGGSDVNGLVYGLSYVWRMGIAVIGLALFIPWAMIDLWNRRWGQMSFGPHEFDAFANTTGLYKRYFAIYAAPVIFLILTGVLGFQGAQQGPQQGPPPFFFVMVVLFYVAIGLLWLGYFAAFLREAIGNLSLSELEFGFTARTFDWVKLMVGNVLLVIVTLGVGLLFLPYRNWKFFVEHLEAYGEINLDELTQSETKVSKHGEGLFDALDIGAM